MTGDNIFDFMIFKALRQRQPAGMKANNPRVVMAAHDVEIKKLEGMLLVAATAAAAPDVRDAIKRVVALHQQRASLPKRPVGPKDRANVAKVNVELDRCAALLKNVPCCVKWPLLRAEMTRLCDVDSAVRATIFVSFELIRSELAK